MRFMNDYDIDMAMRRAEVEDNDVLYAAVLTMAALRDWADANSDGWAYWPKPARAAAKMMEFIEGDGTNRFYENATWSLADYKKALTPIKEFRRQQGADFPVYMPA